MHKALELSPSTSAFRPAHSMLQKPPVPPLRCQLLLVTSFLFQRRLQKDLLTGKLSKHGRYLNHLLFIVFTFTSLSSLYGKQYLAATVPTYFPDVSCVIWCNLPNNPGMHHFPDDKTIRGKKLLIWCQTANKQKPWVSAQKTCHIP